jgi:hypothetical protein
MTSVTRTPLTTLTVKRDTGTGDAVATLTFSRYGNGDLEWTDKDGHRVVASSSDVHVRSLFDAIAALV